MLLFRLLELDKSVPKEVKRQLKAEAEEWVKSKITEQKIEKKEKGQHHPSAQVPEQSISEQKTMAAMEAIPLVASEKTVSDNIEECSNTNKLISLPNTTNVEKVKNNTNSNSNSNDNIIDTKQKESEENIIKEPEVVSTTTSVNTTTTVSSTSNISSTSDTIKTISTPTTSSHNQPSTTSNQRSVENKNERPNKFCKPAVVESKNERRGASGRVTLLPDPPGVRDFSIGMGGDKTTSMDMVCNAAGLSSPYVNKNNTRYGSYRNCGGGSEMGTIISNNNSNASGCSLNLNESNSSSSSSVSSSGIHAMGQQGTQYMKGPRGSHHLGVRRAAGGGGDGSDPREDLDDEREERTNIKITSERTVDDCRTEGMPSKYFIVGKFCFVYEVILTEKLKHFLQ